MTFETKKEGKKGIKNFIYYLDLEPSTIFSWEGLFYLLGLLNLRVIASINQKWKLTYPKWYTHLYQTYPWWEAYKRYDTSPALKAWAKGIILVFVHLWVTLCDLSLLGQKHATNRHMRNVCNSWIWRETFSLEISLLMCARFLLISLC